MSHRQTPHLLCPCLAPVEVVPQCITELAKQLERGKTLIGGLKWRKTLAARMAAAKPVSNQPSVTP